MNEVADSPLGLLSFLSFAFSIIAAVLAIDMFKLLRTGGFGKTWRVLIIASVMLALLQVLHLAEIFNVSPIQEEHLAQVVELCFVMTLAYAFYCQRSVFSSQQQEKKAVPHDDEEFADQEVVDDEEWLDEITGNRDATDHSETKFSALDSPQSHFFSSDTTRHVR